ncbi:response regulator [Caballeronia sp. HLA56]
MITAFSASQQPLILLVDDALDTLGAWQLLLETFGYRVVTAQSGAEGLEKARVWRPHLVITDFMMPVMDGLVLCRHLRADPSLSTVPIILWTAARTTFDNPLFDRLVLKPTQLERLVDDIRVLLRQNLV